MSLGVSGCVVWIFRTRSAMPAVKSSRVAEGEMKFKLSEVSTYFFGGIYYIIILFFWVLFDIWFVIGSCCSCCCWFGDVHVQKRKEGKNR
jgi:hypothetical protein